MIVIVRCLLFVVCFFLVSVWIIARLSCVDCFFVFIAVCRSLFVVRCLRSGVRGCLLVGCCLLYVVCCLLFAALLLFVACGLLSVLVRVLFKVCRLFYRVLCFVLRCLWFVGCC